VKQRIQVIDRVVLGRMSLRIIQNKQGFYEAQVRVKSKPRFIDWGPACEDLNTAYFWAFKAIKAWAQAAGPR
jgi:hypothetical protein